VCLLSYALNKKHCLFSYYSGLVNGNNLIDSNTLQLYLFYVLTEIIVFCEKIRQFLINEQEFDIICVIIMYNIHFVHYLK